MITKLYTSILILLHVTRGISGQDLSCDDNFNINGHISGNRFSTGISGKTYDCSCRGIGCEQITCIQIRAGTDVERVDPTQVCRDPSTGRIYARGTSFLRATRAGINMACVCSEDVRPKIQCKRPQCLIPPPPPPSQNNMERKIGYCYDAHNDNWHPYNIPYIRRVVMSYAPDIIGEYRCTCTAVSIRCTASDIPCCDSRTGTFVAKNQRFVAQLEGLLPMNCMCLGGRGRIGACEELDDRREIEQSERERKKRCLDSTTNRYYYEGSEFTHIRRDGERRCICRRSRKRMKIVCRSIGEEKK